MEQEGCYYRNLCSVSIPRLFDTEIKRDVSQDTSSETNWKAQRIEGFESEDHIALRVNDAKSLGRTAVLRSASRSLVFMLVSTFMQVMCFSRKNIVEKPCKPFTRPPHSCSTAAFGLDFQVFDMNTGGVDHYMWLKHGLQPHTSYRKSRDSVFLNASPLQSENIARVVGPFTSHLCTLWQMFLFSSMRKTARTETERPVADHRTKQQASPFASCPP